VFLFELKNENLIQGYTATLGRLDRCSEFDRLSSDK
ncbi:unnamed protein product, partial [Rotaria sordida]